LAGAEAVAERVEEERMPIKAQKPVRVEDRGWYLTRYFQMVTPDRAQGLRAFHAALRDLCDKFGVDIYSEDNLLKVSERGFKYPDGFDYSAWIDGSQKSRLHIEKTYFDEVKKSNAE
jgi:hypothetical protein